MCLVVWSLQDASLGATADSEALHCPHSCFAPPPALPPPAASAPVAPVEPAGLQKPCTAPLLLLLLLLNDRAPMPATCSVTCCPIKLNFSGKSKSYNTLK